MVLAALWLTAAGCRSETDLHERRPNVPEPEPQQPLSPGPAAPVLDGVFNEWGPDTLLQSDPSGDAGGAFDVTGLHATSRGSELYLHFDTGRELNLAAGPEDEGTLVLTLSLPQNRTLALNFRERRFTVDGGKTISGYDVGYVASPTHAGRAFELKLDLGSLGVSPGESITLQMSGSDEVAPASLQLTHGPAPAITRDAERPPQSSLRLASLNTYQAGLVDPERANAIARLLRAAEADVYLLQELGKTSPGLITSRFEAADPHGDDAEWHTVVQGVGSVIGNAVVSRSPIIGIPTPSPRFVGGVVMLDNPGPVAMFSVHLKCCGYTGSEEDVARLAEAKQLAETIDRLRKGDINEALAPYAQVPVLVAGDFNDVGGAGLHHILERPRQTLVPGSRRTPSAQGLARLRLPHLNSSAHYTWYQSGAGFPPGMLDLLFYDDRQLTALSGFVLDTRHMSDATLEQLAVEPADSTASDHLMLIADFQAR